MKQIIDGIVNQVASIIFPQIIETDKDGTYMNNEEARQILTQLAESIHPITGEIFADQHVCNEPVVIRALYKAISALEEPSQVDLPPQQAKKNERCSRANRVNNSKPWTPDEDTYLRHAHSCGATYEQMSAQLLRSPRVIRYRSVFLGLADSKSIVGRSIPTPGQERRGLPWYPDEDKLLVQMFDAGCCVQDMAVRLKRSVNGVESRLEKHGLMENPHKPKQ